MDLVACNGAISACATGQAAEQALAMMRHSIARMLTSDKCGGHLSEESA